MPCMECSNGKWKYGANGNCQFESKAKCEQGRKAIHANEPKTESLPQGYEMVNAYVDKLE